MNRLTPEALEALLAEHQPLHEGRVTCDKCSLRFPCPSYLLASEVRDARPVIELAELAIGIGASAVELRKAIKARDTNLANAYTATLSLATDELVEKWRAALAHYEEGTK